MTDCLISSDESLKRGPAILALFTRSCKLASGCGIGNGEWGKFSPGHLCSCVFEGWMNEHRNHIFQSKSVAI